MKCYSKVFAIAACALLAGCGDGSSGGVASAGTAPVVPPLPLTANASFQTVASTTTYNGTLSNGILGGGNAQLATFNVAGRSAATTFGYDAASGTYTVTGAGNSASFDATNKIATSDYTSAYSKTAGTVSDSLTLYGNVNASATASPPLVLTYTSFGLWTHGDTSVGTMGGQTSRMYLVFGQPTGGSQMPATGTASYQTTVSASSFQNSFAPAIVANAPGTATIDANFGTGSVTTALTMATGVYNGTAAISSDQFAGTFTSTSATFASGTFAGGFFGPAAKEVGYTFAIHLHNSDPYAGAAITPADMYVTGAVVGVKK